MNSLQLITILISLLVTVIYPEKEHSYPVDVVFIVDGSSDSKELLFRQELLLIPQIISQLSYKHEKIRFGLITYSDQATLQLGLGYVKDNKTLVKKLWKIRHSNSGESSLCFGFRLARTFMFKDNSERKRFIIAFPNSMWNLEKTTSLEASLLRDMGVKIIMVVIGNYVDKNSIKRVSDSMSVIYRPHISLNFIQKNYINNFIVNNIHGREPIMLSTQPMPIYETNTPTTSSSNTTPIVTRNLYSTSRTSITAKYIRYSTINPPYIEHTSSRENIPRSNSITEEPAVPLSPDCSIGGELVFMIDASSSISAENFRKTLEVTAEVVKVIRRDKRDINIAVVTYGNETVINLSYKEWNVSKDAGPFIKNIIQIGGISGLGTALDQVNERIFLNKANYYKIRTVIIFTSTKHRIGIDPILRSNIMRTSIGINFLVVRIGNKTDKWVNDQVSGRQVLSVENFDQLKGFQSKIINALCIF